MQRSTGRLLYDYWDTVRNGRAAPQRFEIEPVRIAPLLPETFILECGGNAGCRYRLAGTRICEQFGRELRGSDFFACWSSKDKPAVEDLVAAVIAESAVACLEFEGYAPDERMVRFELLMLPLMHLGERVNRIMGSITAIDPPYWLGARPLARFVVTNLDMDCPGRRPCVPGEAPQLAILARDKAVSFRDVQRRFRVLDGGLATPGKPDRNSTGGGGNPSFPSGT